jgi:hypothetical protein
LSEPLQILVISDGKPGHENQSLGLAEAMGRRCPVEIRTLRLDTAKGAVGRIRMALATDGRPKPNFVIAAGSATHLPLFFVARKYGAHSIVLMKPSLPFRFFGTCIIPEHDFTRSPQAPNIILTKGAPNRVIHTEPWQLADSRRTPGTLLPALKAALPHLEVFPHGETEPGWLAGKLSELEEIRVTEDSVSMIYEALSSGAKVGVLEMPRLRPDARVLRGLKALREQGYLGGDTPKVLSESDRCAAIIFALDTM